MDLLLRIFCSNSLADCNNQIVELPHFLQVFLLVFAISSNSMSIRRYKEVLVPDEKWVVLARSKHLFPIVNQPGQKLSSIG